MVSIVAMASPAEGGKAALAEVVIVSSSDDLLSSYDKRISDFTAELLKQSRVRGRIGQPSVPLALNPDGAFAIGVKVGRRGAELRHHIPCLLHSAGVGRRFLRTRRHRLTRSGSRRPGFCETCSHTLFHLGCKFFRHSHNSCCSTRDERLELTARK